MHDKDEIFGTDHQPWHRYGNIITILTVVKIAPSRLPPPSSSLRPRVSMARARMVTAVAAPIATALRMRSTRPRRTGPT